MKKERIAVLVLFVLLVLFSVSCFAFAGPNPMKAKNSPPGFLHGLAHGFFVPLSFVISWFTDKISIYAVENNGFLYDLGYIIGLFFSFGSTGAGLNHH